ncbi:aminoglycoside 6-adenylyltransferase [Xanthomonas perforans]|nr:aminoglycoside 6-adenylyltransferase [Xanthomonas perforans]
MIVRLSQDPRILGLAAGGSWLTGELDEFSDLDLVIVCDPGRSRSVLEDAPHLAQQLGPCLASFPGDHLGVPNLLICLFDDPLLHVDLKFVALDEFNRRVENPEVLWERDGALTKVIESSQPTTPTLDLQWIEDRFWTWIHYGSQRLGRGEIFETLAMLSYLRERVLGPMESVRATRIPRGVRRLEKYVDAEDLQQLRSTVARHDARNCSQALKNAAKMYVGLREILDKGNLQRNRRAEMASLRYLHEISEKL